jgi:hypothetical protein
MSKSQRTLFLQPDRGSEPIQNPLLVAMFTPFFASGSVDENGGQMRMPWAAKAEDAFKRRTQAGHSAPGADDERHRDLPRGHPVVRAASGAERRRPAPAYGYLCCMTSRYHFSLNPRFLRFAHAGIMGWASEAISLSPLCARARRIQYGYRPRVEYRFKRDEWKGANIK